MNILFMAHAWPPAHNAGAEWMSHSLLRALAQRGHDVHVWLSDAILNGRSNGDQDFDLDGVHVHPFRDKGDVFPLVANADLVMAHLQNMPRAVILARMNSKPFGLVMHNGHQGSTTWNVDDASLVVFNSEWMAQHFGGHPHGIVVHPPVFADDYRVTPGHKVTLINVNIEKGGRLFWQLADRMPDVDFLGVIGAYGLQVVRAEGLPNVEMRDHLSGAQMRDVYRTTRILLMPSAYESWGRTAVEAMVSGIPVIAHPTDGLLECLGDAGIFRDRDDPAAWEHEIRRLLNHEEWQQASKAALIRARELDPTEDLRRFVQAVEAIGATR